VAVGLGTLDTLQGVAVDQLKAAVGPGRFVAQQGAAVEQLKADEDN
jgi:hypothetical protein